MKKTTVEYRPQSAAATVELIARGVGPWQAIGQFVDDWRRTPLDLRPSLCAEPLPSLTSEDARWEAFMAAAVEWLCAQDGLPFPGWTSKSEYRLSEPWFLYPGWRLRAWQLVETPTPFRMRNIFGGDRILARV